MRQDKFVPRNRPKSSSLIAQLTRGLFFSRGRPEIPVGGRLRGFNPTEYNGDWQSAKQALSIEANELMLLPFRGLDYGEREIRCPGDNAVCL